MNNHPDGEHDCISKDAIRAVIELKRQEAEELGLNDNPLIKAGHSLLNDTYDDLIKILGL